MDCLNLQMLFYPRNVPTLNLSFFSFQVYVKLEQNCLYTMTIVRKTPILRVKFYIRY